MVGRKHHRPVPTWLIIALGAVATGAALIWASSLRDEQGEKLLDSSTATVLITLIGVVGTLLSLLLKTTAEVKHESQPNSGSSWRDSTNRTEADVTELKATVAQIASKAEHLERAHRQNAGDLAALRQDVQQARKESADNLGGLRKDIGRLADIITKGSS